MALVVFLRGLNVGGHRTFRPTTLAARLRHLDAVNVGAAGTFLIRQAVSRSRLRAEVERELPFDAEIAICESREIVGLLSRDFFRGHPVRPDIVRFVGVLSRRPRSEPSLPLRLPAGGGWLLEVLAREDRFVLGLYRRHMKVIGYLGSLERLFGVPVTTRNWNTIAAIGRLLREAPLLRPAGPESGAERDQKAESQHGESRQRLAGRVLDLQVHRDGARH